MTCREDGGACVIASVSEAIQMARAGILDCFVAIAPRNDAATDVSRERVSISSLPGIRRAAPSSHQMTRQSMRTAACQFGVLIRRRRGPPVKPCGDDWETERASPLRASGGRGNHSFKADEVPVVRPPTRCGQTRAQTRRRNNRGRRAVAALQSRATVAHPTIGHALPSNNCPASPIWMAGTGTSTFGAGTPTNPKRALPVFIRLYANSNFAHAAFSTGSEKTS
jgi:hypothetical protein